MLIAIESARSAAAHDNSVARAATTARLVAAMAVALSLQIVVAGISTAVSAILITCRGLPPTVNPPAPLMLVVIAFATTWCSVSAIWWAQSMLPSHVKTALAVLGCAAVWGCFVSVHPRGGEAAAAAGWAASFVLQAVLTALAVVIVQLARKTSRSRFCSRYSLAFLFIWTTVVACFLAAARWLAGRYGWTADSFASDEFFVQLQAVGAASAVLASVALACIRMSATLATKLAACGIVICVVSGAATGVMYFLFGAGFGAPLLEYFWLLMTEGLLLTVTLLPLEIATAASRTTSSRTV